MSRRPRAAEPSPPARRWNETGVKVDRRNPFWRGGRAADGRRGRRWRRRAPKVPRQPPPPPPPPPVRAGFPARRRPPCRAPLRALPFTVAPEGQKKGATGGLVGTGAPHPGQGDTGNRREHHGHRAALATGFRSSRERPGRVEWAAVAAPSPHAAVPALPRGLEEGQVSTGDRLPPVPLRPSFPPSGSDSPPARRALGCPSELRAAPENSAGKSSGSRAG